MMADLMRWNPFDEFRRITEAFERELNRWWSRPAWTAYSSFDTRISTSDDGYRIRIPLPGIAPEHVEVNVTGRTLHVRATEREGDSDVVRYEQVLTLPATVDTEKIAATFNHGLLELTCPYQEAVKPRRIQIATEAPKQLQAA
jgi:HSP20 family protein